MDLNFQVVMNRKNLPSYNRNCCTIIRASNKDGFEYKLFQDFYPRGWVGGGREWKLTLSISVCIILSDSVSVHPSIQNLVSYISSFVLSSEDVHVALEF